MRLLRIVTQGILSEATALGKIFGYFNVHCVGDFCYGTLGLRYFIGHFLNLFFLMLLVLS